MCGCFINCWAKIKAMCNCWAKCFAQCDCLAKCKDELNMTIILIFILLTIIIGLLLWILITILFDVIGNAEVTADYYISLQLALPQTPETEAYIRAIDYTFKAVCLNIEWGLILFFISGCISLFIVWHKVQGSDLY